jgi:hypothetical protein
MSRKVLQSELSKNNSKVFDKFLKNVLEFKAQLIAASRKKQGESRHLQRLIP